MEPAVIKVLERVVSSAAIQSPEASDLLHSWQHDFCSEQFVNT